MRGTSIILFPTFKSVCLSVHQRFVFTLNPNYSVTDFFKLAEELILGRAVLKLEMGNFRQKSTVMALDGR